MKYRVITSFDHAPTPSSSWENQTHARTETKELDTEEEVKEYLDDLIWQVDDIENNGRAFDGNKEYGYWSMTKDRQTGKQWYIRATVRIETMETESVAVEDVLN